MEVILVQMVHVEEICARKAIHVEIPNGLSKNTKSALERLGVTRLYSHQVQMLLCNAILLKPLFNGEVSILVICAGRVNKCFPCWEECGCGNYDIQWEISLLQCSSCGSVVPEFIIMCLILVSNKGLLRVIFFLYLFYLILLNFFGM